MIKGWYRGYSGLLYIYYRGEDQVVLSDTNAGFNMTANKLADTALRIVLKPHSWTQVASSYVQSGLEEGSSMLANLEKTNMVDIFTDAAEVKRIESSGLDPRDFEAQEQARQAQAAAPRQVYAEPAPMNYNMPQYPRRNFSTPMGTVDYPFDPYRTPFGQPQPDRFFDMNMMPNAHPGIQQAPVVPPVKQNVANPVSNELSGELKAVLSSLKAQADASTKQAEAITTMMATMTKSLEVLAQKLTDKADK